MIQFNKAEGQKILELGGGSNRHFQTDVNVDSRAVPGVDFVADFNEPLPIRSREFDAVFCQYALEHISYRKIQQLLSEVSRVLKPGGMAIFITSNTEAQIEWIKQNPNGWDGKDIFESASCVLFGDQDYPDNSHKCYFSPTILANLFWSVPFEKVAIQPAGERKTDLIVTAMKPMPQEMPVREEHKVIPNVLGTNVVTKLEEKPVAAEPTPPDDDREKLFDKYYFNGGGKVGGYAREGYWDYPVHEVTANHILARKPKSVLELGCARGYILKRLIAKGITHAAGWEISQHCWMTSVTPEVDRVDICLPRYWNKLENKSFDLVYSVATLEHIPEQFLPTIIQGMARVAERGLHGIDFGHNDDGFDKTHCTLKPKEWWLAMFSNLAPGWPVEIVDKEELEKGDIPQSYYDGDGKKKLNIGSFTTMFHHGWTNIDIHDLMQFAMHYKYDFKQLDVRNGLPYGTGVVDAIYCAHMLEHLSYADGIKFLRECRRIIRKDGVVRFLVPDAETLNMMYAEGRLGEFDEINDGCANASSQAAKLWSLLHEGHSSCYDVKALLSAFSDAGFDAVQVDQATTHSKSSLAQQIVNETFDGFPCLSLICEAVPRLS